MPVTLALDVGDARIGVAVTDEAGTTALAHTVITATPLREAVAALAELAAATHAARVVVGLPLTLEGREGTQARKTRAFADVLQRTVPLPLEFVDERFTSGEAGRIAREKGSALDAEAARLILDAWLARHRTP